MEQNPEYSNQTWFYSGKGNELDKDKIKQYWDEDKYITSVAYTSNGWFVTMSKDSKFTDQSYSYKASLPEAWIKEKWDAGYYITAVSRSESKWFVVMSKRQGYTSQSYYFSTTNNLGPWYKKKRNEGYFLTSATFESGKWLWVMTKGTNISTQGYTWTKDYNLNSEIKKLWDKGYRLHLVEYGYGDYLIAYGNLTGRTPQQAYNTSCSNISEWIKKNWNEGMSLHYVGGINPEHAQSNTTYAQNNTTTNQYGYSTTRKPGDKTWTETLPGGGRRQSTMQADGSILSITSTPCIWCHGNKMCSICNGAGGTYGRAYGGMWYPCKSCAGSKICQNCHGQGYSTLSSTTYPDGTGVGYDQNGRMVVTGDGGGSNNGSSRSGNRSSRNRSSSGTCSKCGGIGYEPKPYQYAAGSSMTPYHNTVNTTCYICSLRTDHYHYRCVNCKRK